MSNDSEQDPGAEEWPAPPQGHQPPPPASHQVPPYGAQPQQQPYGAPLIPAQSQGNGMGVAGFVTGLLGLIFFWVPFLGLVLALVGVSLSGVGVARGKRLNAPTGLAIAGLVLSIIALIPAVFVVVALLAVGSGAATVG